MQRREFLVLGGRAAASVSTLAFVPVSLRASTSSQTPSVIVVGAGLAGLTAAYELRKGGAAVTLLEADSRPGGRVRTLRSSFADGLYAEAGGQTFFPIVEDYVAPYLDEFGLQRTAPGPSGLGQVFVMRGERIMEPDRPNLDWPLDLSDAEQASGLAGMRREYLAPLRSALNGAPGDWDWEGLRGLDEISLEAWMADRGASADAIELVNLARMDFSVLPASSHSALAVAIGQESFNRLVGRPFSVEGGNDRLVRAFADRLRDRIRYGARVHRVLQSPEGVEVEYARAGQTYSVEAARLVCALPPWALNEISFEPRLSQEKRSALGQLPTSNVCRFFIQTSRRVWREQGLSGSAITDRRVSYFWESSPWLEGPRGILHGWIGAPGRTEFERMSPQERSAFAVAEAETVFPGISDYVEGVDSWCWGSDPVVSGHGMAVPPGQFTSSVVDLDRPEGRIHFTGAETAPVLVKGFLQGAVASGRRVAVEVLEAARQNRRCG